MTRLTRTLETIDHLHRQDPDQIDGQPSELIYAERMSGWLQRLQPDASEALQIAVRSQHLCRWEIPRSEYPMGRPGYLKWRMELGKLHARKAVKVMTVQGYDSEACERVAAIIRKQNMKRDSDAQTLEDCACLVFMENDFLPFAAKHTEEKVIRIVQKTWAKMSTQAQQTALGLSLPDKALELVQKALA